MKLHVALAVFLFSAPAAFASDAAVDATIKGFADAFNKGDMKAAKALHTSSPVIVDEVPPHYWSGMNAFDQWGADLGKFDAALGVSGDKVAIGKPTREEINGDHAYVIAPATYNFQQKGVAMHEKSQMTFVLVKDSGAWKIASWTWTGPAATPVK